MSSPSHHGQKRPRQPSGDLASLRYAADLAAAYDAAAPAYSRTAREHQWMREVLWRRYGRLFRAGDRVLDVGCGTGLDALWLARRGVRVTAIDLSQRMIAELEHEAERQQLAGRIQAQVANAAELTRWPGKYFHGIISAFGVLNTVQDLTGFAADAARLLLPRGRLVVHVTAPGDVWERRRRSRREGSRAAAEYFRRRRRTQTIAGVPIRHRVIGSDDTYRLYFAPHFRLRHRLGLGFLLPEERMKRLSPGLARLVGWLEAALGVLPPVRHRSRFFVLDLENRAQALP